MRISKAVERRLIKKALHSPCRHKVAAAGVNHRGEVVGYTYNTRRFFGSGGGWHAEEVLMHKTPPNLKYIWIVRVNLRGNTLPIDPCRKCQRLAEKMNVKIIPVL